MPALLLSAHDILTASPRRHGDLADLQDYSGGRDFDALKEFASENLGPSCSPDNIDLCSAEQKASIEEIQKMSDDEIDTKISESDAAMEKAETDFKTAVEGLQAQYEQLQKDKDDAIKEVKGSGLGVLKQVQASRSKVRRAACPCPCPCSSLSAPAPAAPVSAFRSCSCPCFCSFCPPPCARGHAPRACSSVLVVRGGRLRPASTGGVQR